MWIESFDYGQIEARCFGITAADPAYLQALYKGYDIHLEAALHLLDGNRELAATYRNDVKQIVFAALFGAGNDRCAGGLGMLAPYTDMGTVGSRIRSYVLDRFPTFRVWQKEVSRVAYQVGYAETLFGVRRY